MKTITCAEMGGPCEVGITGASEKEVTDKGWEHVVEAHPEMLEDMKKMPPEAMAAWAAKFHETYEAKQEDIAQVA